MTIVDIAKFVRQTRKKLGLTQDKFARLVGVKRSTVTNYELGEINPSAEVLLRIQALDNKNDTVCQ